MAAAGRRLGNRELRLELLQRAFDPRRVRIEEGEQALRVLWTAATDLLRFGDPPESRHPFGPRGMESEPLVE